MPIDPPLTRRGLVMNGGGAKGLYEAGAIQAFHLLDLHFDIITGSSIGAMNSVFCAEQELRWRRGKGDPNLLSELQARIAAYHRAWLALPTLRLIDDSLTGGIGRIQSDLRNFDFGVPHLVQLLWWWTDPDPYARLDASIWPTIARVVWELAERIGAVEFMRLLLRYGQRLARPGLRSYLRNYGVERSLIPVSDDAKLRGVFAGAQAPLTEPELDFTAAVAAPPASPTYTLVPAERTFKDFAAAGLDVRLTRANYRTGRLETSGYVTDADFAAFLHSHQHMLLNSEDPRAVPLGSFRMLIPGNPLAVEAALASGRFPGVLAPFPFAQIYPIEDPENGLVYRLQASRPGAHAAPATAAQGPVSPLEADLQRSLQASRHLINFFPWQNDIYIDGGAIDNTPSNGAIDLFRDWLKKKQISNRDAWLDLYVVHLDPEPSAPEQSSLDPDLVDVAIRALGLVNAAGQSSDALTVDTINGFGRRAEEVARTLQALVTALQALPDAERQTSESAIFTALQNTAGLHADPGTEPAGLVERLAAWTSEAIAHRLPVEVNAIKIYPREMPMGTLQFTERFGFRRANAIAMVTCGCADTVWAVRLHLEQKGWRLRGCLDQADQVTLERARRLMAIESIGRTPAEHHAARERWRCAHQTCMFHRRHCARGANPPGPARHQDAPTT